MHFHGIDARPATLTAEGSMVTKRTSSKNTSKRATAAAPATVDEYLAGLRPDFRAALTKLRRRIRAAAPQATESISYQIPTFKHNGRPLVYFAAATNHCAIHAVGSEHLEVAKRQGFGVGRGSIRFTPDKPLPDGLVARIVKDRLAELEAGARTYGGRAKQR
jgi:uncharacterized protein YdhG (YjbR/CyaY superfamily)